MKAGSGITLEGVLHRYANRPWSVKALAQHTGWSDAYVRDHAAHLVEIGLVTTQTNKRVGQIAYRTYQWKA